MPESTPGAIGASKPFLRPSVAIVGAFISNNPTAAAAVAALIAQIHEVLTGLAAPEESRRRGKPAVPVSRSVQNDYIVCLEDGKKLKLLKRYLRARYGLSPEDYRRRWGLAPDYPMVAPAYAQRRSEFARQIGLGRGGRSNA
jgi:predicted transcriptional regulator